MRAITTLRRITGRNTTVDMRGRLRLREPHGLLTSDEATSRLLALVGSQVGAADTSMDRLVVAVTTEPMHLVVVAGPIVVANSGSESGAQVSVCHQPGTPEAVSAVHTLSGRVITDVVVTPAGSLRIGVEGGHLSVDADPNYEAWEIRGMDGGLLACLPGGTISLWAPVEDPDASSRAAGPTAGLPESA